MYKHKQLTLSYLKGTIKSMEFIFSDMERTVRSLEHVINYYMVSRELADLIQAGPNTSTTDSLNVYLEVSLAYITRIIE